MFKDPGLINDHSLQVPGLQGTLVQTSASDMSFFKNNCAVSETFTLKTVEEIEVLKVIHFKIFQKTFLKSKAVRENGQMRTYICIKKIIKYELQND